ncbi:BAG family molecular chaperone regulator 1-like [Lingula anatina]|uniref:BAG family molecular chaperone regulator 1-like n=1 Tax=Lingula anatina TaxID=7574 RepID=A0A2R2MNJ7_LINAN|nr:BAG family molecular chaperone regulator 1-like [Lingula anatina]|eukprot:XP_023931622.1 BAG family molecular chaperone regulator 1-like [Lingula anatina]
MAADGVNELRLKLVHGQSHHNLLLALPTEEAGDVLTVRHLAKEVFIATGVPIPGQRLIFKGKSLKDPSEHLSKLGMKQDSKIMLIGKKPSPFEDAILNQLSTVEKAQEKTEKKQSEITLELDGIHRGLDMKLDLWAGAMKTHLGASESQGITVQKGK